MKRNICTKKNPCSTEPDLSDVRCELCRAIYELENMKPGFDRANEARYELATFLQVPGLWDNIIAEIKRLKVLDTKPLCEPVLVRELGKLRAVYGCHIVQKAEGGKVLFPSSMDSGIYQWGTMVSATPRTIKQHFDRLRKSSTKHYHWNH